MIAQTDSGFTFDADYGQPGEAPDDGRADALADFVYAGAVTAGNRAQIPQKPLFDLAGAMSTAPEPGGWLLLVGGFALIGLTMRRRDATPTLGHAQII